MDVEKTIEFILGQMADFAVGMQQLRESQAELRDGLVRTVEVVNQLAVAQREFAQYTEQRFQALTDEVRELTGEVRTIADNLNALIKVVDDLVRRDGPRPQ